MYMDERLQHLPYGPLTREDFESLALSFYDASRWEAQRVAASRGISSGEYLRLQFGEKKARAAESLGPAALRHLKHD